MDRRCAINSVFSGFLEVPYCYLPELLAKRGVEVEPALAVLDQLKRLIQPVEKEWLEAFEVQARLRLKLPDEDD